MNSYLVRQRDQRRRHELVVVLVTALALGGCLVGYVWLHVDLLRTGYRVDTLEEELREAARRERELQLEARYLARPELIERRALEELGMRAPALDQVIFEEEIE